MQRHCYQPAGTEYLPDVAQQTESSTGCLCPRQKQKQTQVYHFCAIPYFEKRIPIKSVQKYYFMLCFIFIVL